MPDFFKDDCKEAPRKDVLYGICDKPSDRAYTTNIAQKTWVATVKNNNAIHITFTAVDKCVINDDEYPGMSRCDGMLTTDERLYLIELKERKTSGINSKAIKQLESTIQLLAKSHPKKILEFKHKKAFVCNKRKPHFVVVDSELQRRFYNTYNFRIDIQAIIVVI